MPKLLLAIFLLTSATSSRADDLGPSLAASMPGGALSFVETTGLSELIRRVQASEVFQSVMASEDWKQWEKTRIYREFKKSRRLVEFLLRMDIWEVSDKLLGGRLAVAIYPQGVGEEPGFAFLIRPSEPSEWLSDRMRYAPIIRVGIKRIDKEDFGETVLAYRTRGFDEDKATYFATHPDWIAIASGSELLRQTVALQAPAGIAFEAGAPVGAEPEFQKMDARLGGRHLARAFMSPKRITEVTGENLGLPEEIGDPVLALFLGGVVELLDNSRFAGMTLDYDDKEIAFRSAIDARPEEIAEEHRLFFSKGPAQGLAPPPQVPGYIGGFSLYRPFSEWYRKRDEAVQGALVPGLKGFEGGVGDLLLGNEGVVGDRVTFVSAQAEDGGFDVGGIKLPGFAFIVDLKDPAGADDALGPLFEAAIGEIDTGHKIEAPWELVADEHSGVPVNFAKREGDTMRPSAARVGGRWVLSSSRSLCEEVIDHLLEGEPEGSERDLAFELRFSELAKFFAEHQTEYEAELVRRGRTPVQAKADYANIAKLMAGMVSLSGESTAGDGAFEFVARGTFK